MIHLLGSRCALILSTRLSCGYPLTFLLEKSVCIIHCKYFAKHMLRIIAASVSARSCGVDMSIPSIWASPVIPGRVPKTPYFLRISIRLNWFGKQGRGPTKLISPFRTHHSCGSSSIFVRLRNLPHRVT